MYPKVGEKRSIDDINLEDEEAIGSLCRLSGRAVSPKSAMEHEKRIRREIANSNERRRMQSINSGFSALKSLLPHHEGEKLSKAAILQQTAEYIYRLEQEKTRLLAQNCQLKRLLNQQHHSDNEGSPAGSDSPNDDRTQSNGTSPLSTPLPISIDSQSIHGSIVVSHDKDSGIEERPVKVKVESLSRVPPSHSVGNSEYEVSTEHDISFPPEVKLQYSSQKVNIIQSKLEISESMKRETDSSTSCQEHVSLEGMEVTSAPGQDLFLMKPISGLESVSTVSGNGSSILSSSVSCATQLPIASSCVIDSNPVLSKQQPTAVIGREMISGASSFHSISKQSFTPSSGTILTVLPSNKTKRLGPLLDLRNLSELDRERVISSAESGTTVKYVDGTPAESALRNHTLYIVESSNSPCQKNLDTICEAIRHLEGDHLFQSEENPLHEEVVTTDGTFVVEERPSVRHGGHARTVTSSDRKGVVPSFSVDYDSVPALREEEEASLANHLTLHMIQSEPQEVPLELTTTPRSTPDVALPSSINGSSTTVKERQLHHRKHSPFSSFTVGTSSSMRSGAASDLILSPTNSRPGVIVVKSQ